jgi:dihydrofolate reductase
VPRLIYSMNPSLDGFVADPSGEIDWGVPDEEQHRFHNDEVRNLGAHLLGRRLYETMLYWETDVVGNSRLATGSVAEEVAALKERPGKDVGVGGATFAAECARLDLIDEYRLVVSPILLGGGTPYFPPLAERLPLELLETRTFGSRAVYLRYARAR